MNYVYLIPNWFFGFDSAMEILFGIITLAVSFVAWKIYRITQEKTVRHFSVGFFLIACSYILWAGINMFVVSKASEGVHLLAWDNLAVMSLLGVYAHMLLLISGLVTLAYTTFKIRNGGVYYIMLGLSLLVIVVSLNKIITFRILSVFLLSFITYYYFIEYLFRQNKKTQRIFIAFFLLLLSNLDFVFSSHSYQAYVLGHFIQLGAYILILMSLINSTKR